MYRLVQSLLFRLEAESAHRFSLRALNALHRGRLTGLISSAPKSVPKTVMGLTFPNPVGLAAGMDKDGRYLDALGALGFGFVEVGTVTPRPQRGNPRPRVFRIPEAEAIINRMGFNNAGVDALVARLQKRTYRGRVGVNIGKNADIPLAEAVNDYRFCMQKVYPWADYIAVNISSPNTPGLRDLQERDLLHNLLDGLKSEQERLWGQWGRYVPFAIKIAPDLTDAEIETLASTLVEFRVDGVIATNTTLARSGVANLNHAEEAGGLSGAPLRETSVHVIRVLSRVLNGRIPIIGVGGILSAADAGEKIRAGADLIQLYTGFVYRGPDLIREAVSAFKPSS